MSIHTSVSAIALWGGYLRGLACKYRDDIPQALWMRYMCLKNSATVCTPRGSLVATHVHTTRRDQPRSYLAEHTEHPSLHCTRYSGRFRTRPPAGTDTSVMSASVRHMHGVSCVVRPLSPTEGGRHCLTCLGRHLCGDTASCLHACLVLQLALGRQCLFLSVVSGRRPPVTTKSPRRDIIRCSHGSVALSMVRHACSTRMHSSFSFASSCLVSSACSELHSAHFMGMSHIGLHAAGMRGGPSLGGGGV